MEKGTGFYETFINLREGNMKEAVLALQRANGQRDYIALARELVASQGTDAEQAFEDALRQLRSR